MNLKIWWIWIAALICGALATTAFAPLNWWWMLPLSTLALWQLWYLRPSNAFSIGWLWGLSHLGTGVYWLFNSLHYFGNAHWLTAILMTAGLVAFLSLYPALAGYIWYRLSRRYWQNQSGDGLEWIALSLLWWFSEYARTTLILGGFPWLMSGYTQVDGWASDWLAVLGVVGVSALLSFVTVGLHLSIRTSRFWQWRWRPDIFQLKNFARIFIFRRFTAMFFIILIVWLLGAFLPKWSEPVDAIRFGILHTDTPQLEKYIPQLERKAFKRMMRASAQSQADVIVWPETAIPFSANFRGSGRIGQIQRLAKRQQSDYFIGVFYRSDSGQNHNSVYGLIQGKEHYYHKQRLVPFGEFMPARGLLGFLDYWIDIPQSDLFPGPLEPAALALNGIAVHLNICYELFFTEIIYQQAREANLLLNVSNDAWFGRLLAPAQSLQMARVRSLETDRPILRASNQGISAIIDAGGKVLAQTKDDYKMLEETVYGRRGLTPIVWLGEPTVVIIILLMGGLSWWILYTRRSSAVQSPAKI